MEPNKPKRTVEEIVKQYATPLSIITAGIIIAVALSGDPVKSTANTTADLSALQEAVVPSEGVELPITWGDIGARLVEVGAIDREKLESLYENRGGFPPKFKKLLEKNANDKIVMTNSNAGYLLNLLWALGLANKNPILEDKSEMMNPSYGGAENFASTGGWTLSLGSTMDHYNKYSIVPLTKDQQTIVDRVSRNIYRPCCGNSVHFPDCNHGMAMLGLLELMASQGVSEQEMYKIALSVNSYWFPDTYITIATYMHQKKGIDWKDVSPKEMLGADYSSGSGFSKIYSQVAEPQQGNTGGGCSA